MTYSLPLSYLNILIFCPDAFSIKAFNSVNVSKTFDFFLIKKTHEYLEKSSMKVKTYLDPFMDVIGIGLMISECISPKMHDAQLAFPRSNLCSGCFPTTQPLQIPVVALMTRRPSTMEFFCSFYNYLKLKWLNLSCHSLLTSFPWVSNAVGFASATISRIYQERFGIWSAFHENMISFMPWFLILLISPPKDFQKIDVISLKERGSFINILLHAGIFRVEALPTVWTLEFFLSMMPFSFILLWVGRLIMLLVFNFRLRSFKFGFWVLLLLSFTLQVFELQRELDLGRIWWSPFGQDYHVHLLGTQWRHWVMESSIQGSWASSLGM